LPVSTYPTPVSKGKPVERQGRKATDLRVNSYDSGVTDILEQANFDVFFGLAASENRQNGGFVADGRSLGL
jgi:hypothetical protein